MAKQKVNMESRNYPLRFSLCIGWSLVDKINQASLEIPALLRWC